PRPPSVDRPKPRRDELDRMPIGIANVHALAAPLPANPALDLDSMLLETGQPSVDGVGRNGERDMLNARAAMRWHDAAERRQGRGRRAALEKKEDAHSRHAER